MYLTVNSNISENLSLTKIAEICAEAVVDACSKSTYC